MQHVKATDFTAYFNTCHVCPGFVTPFAGADRLFRYGVALQKIDDREMVVDLRLETPKNADSLLPHRRGWLVYWFRLRGDGNVSPLKFAWSDDAPPYNARPYDLPLHQRRTRFATADQLAVFTLQVAIALLQRDTKMVHHALDDFIKTRGFNPFDEDSFSQHEVMMAEQGGPKPHLVLV